MTRDDALSPDNIVWKIYRLLQSQLEYPGWMPTLDKTGGFKVLVLKTEDPRRGEYGRCYRNTLTRAGHWILEHVNDSDPKTYSGYRLAVSRSKDPNGDDLIVIWVWTMNLPLGFEDGLPVDTNILSTAII